MYRRLELENENLLLDIELMEKEIRENSQHAANADRGLLWFHYITKYMELLIKTQQETSDRLSDEVQIRLAGTTTAYWWAIGKSLIVL